MKILLYDSRSHLLSGKLWSCWMSPFVVTHVFPFGTVKIHDPVSGPKQKVNHQRLKQFMEFPTADDVKCLMLHEPPSDFL